MKASTIFYGAALGAVLIPSCALSAEAGPGSASLPAEVFASLAEMNQPRLSPSGDAVAILVKNTAGRRQLAILDTQNLSNAKVIAGFVDADVANVYWVDNQRLIYSAWSQQASAWESVGSVRMAVDRDGQHQVQLSGAAMRVATEKSVHTSMASFVRTLDDGTGEVIEADWAHTDVMGYGNRWLDSTPKRYDTRQGVAKSILQGRVPHDVQEWIVDDHGTVRGGISQNEKETMLISPNESGEWIERARYPTWGETAKRFDPVAFATDGQFYVRYSPGHAGYGLYRMDIRTGIIEPKAVVVAPGFDLDPELIEDRKQHKVIGVRYETDAEGTVWFDAGMKAIQAKVDAKLPGLINRLNPATCGCSKRILVISYSDRQPSLFYLYDKEDDSLVQIGSARPRIDPRQSATTDFFRIKARDGHDLPVYVTKPAGKGPWPAVVLVHGGPYLRGWSWEWDGDSQFLASRGYVVVKPEFRGSDGYGDDLRTSGYRQWGLAMQDDIADATRWAAAQGLADPTRTCIAGGSYGGYATLMGLVRYPELYRCGMASAAVTDLSLLHDIYWSDMDSIYRANGMPVLVGDPEKDAAQFAATSPLQQAGKITRPLLLAHGGLDRRVPIEHAVKLRRELESNHAPVTWVEYKDEAHGWFKPDNRADYLRRMEAFLAANIGAGTMAASAGAGASTPLSIASH